MKRRFTKSLVAMIALVAMLTQNAYGVYAAASSPEPIQVENDTLQTEEAATPEIVVETENNEGSTEEATPVEYVDGGVEESAEQPTDDVNYDDQVMLIDESEGQVVEEVTEEPVEEVVDENLDILDTQISGSGLDELEVFVDTSKLNSGDAFRIIFVGADSAQYDTRLNDNLDATSQGIYRFINLNKEGFNIRATSDDDVSFEFTSEGGTPTIKVISNVEEVVKVLERKQITLRDGSPVTAISGEGFENVKIDFNTASLAKDLKFAFVIETEATVTANGDTVSGKIKGLDNTAEPITVAGLDGKEFVMYVEPAGADFITSEIEEIFEDDGKVTIEVAGEETRIKRIYTYEDDQVSVTATLSDPKAVPDDAEFKVTPITVQKAVDAYIEALNDNSSEEIEYTEENTLLYDIAFLVDKKDEDGNVIEGEKVEFEPEVGRVKIEINYKKSQLSDELGAEEANDIEVKHLPLTDAALESVDATVDATSITASDIKVEDVRAEVVVTENGTDTVEFTTDSLSVYAFISSKDRHVELKKGADATPKSVLDAAVRYGIVAEYVEQKAHMDSNFATKDYKSNGNNTTSGAYSKDANGNKVGFYYYVGKIQDSFKADGKENKVYVPDAYKGKIKSDNTGTIDTSLTEAEIDAVVDSLLSTVKTNAANLLASTNNIVKIEKSEWDSVKNKQNGTKFPGRSNYFGQNNDGVIDLTGADAGTYYFDFDDFATAGKLEGFDIKLNDNQYVVFLYPNATDVRLGGYKVNGTQSNNSVFASKHVLFYAPKAEKFNIVETCGGTFIAPKATVDTTTGSPSGWIVVKNFYNGSGEWHNVFDELPPVTIPTSVTFHVKKTLENNGTDTPAFEFELWETGQNYYTHKVDPTDKKVNTKIQTIRINNYSDNVGTLAFNTINYNKPADVGTHYYVIKEKDANSNGWTANHTYGYAEVTVAAVQAGRDTKYEVTKIRASYDVQGGDGNRNLVEPKTVACQDPEFQFVNSKAGIKEGTTVDFKASKLFAVDGTWPAGKTFQLKLEALDTSYDKVGHINGKGPLPGGKTEPIIVTVSADNPVADFGSIDFDYEPNAAEKVDPNWSWKNNYQTKEHTPDMPDGAMFRAYLYRITEVIPAGATAANDYTVDGIKYDPSERYVKIFLNKAYNSALNKYKLETQIRVSPSNELGSCFEDADIQAFTNDVTFETEISGTKTVLPKKVGLKAKEYTFEITKGEGTPNPTPMPSTTVVYNDANGNFSFPAIKYDSSCIGKTYKYVVEEKPGNNNAMHYSTEKYEVTVVVANTGITKTVKKVGSNADASADTAINFVNKISAAGSQTFAAKKVYNLGLEGGEFTFKLEGARGVSETKTNLADGTVPFATVENYTESDITADGDAYVYYISEVIPDTKNAGITYSNDVYRYTVQVKDGGADAEVINGKAKLNIITSIDKSSDGKAVDDATKSWSPYTTGTPSFTNTYTVDGEGSITVVKSIGATDSLSAKTLANKKFSFKVTETESPNTTKYAKELEVTGAGTAVFDKINFEKAGTYKFTVEETNIPSGAVNGVYEGITYDTTKHEIVMVVKDGGNGKFVIESQTNDGATVEVGSALEITNTYDVKETTTNIEGNKVVTGRDWNAEDDVYSFVIEAIDDAPLPAVTEVSNNTAGKFAFGPITYTQSGDYKYTVYEKDTTVVGITKDSKVYTVTVPVRDNGQGQLVVGTKIYEVGTEDKPKTELKFSNTYNADGSETIHVKKVLDSKVKSLNAHEYEFELSDANKTLLQRDVWNDANGDATFAPISYTLEQLGGAPSKVFTYYVRELNTEKPPKGYTYDGTYHQVDITVTNNTKTGKLDTEVKYYDSESDAVKITNKYEAKGDIELGGTKTMVGRKIGADEEIEIVLEPVSATKLDGTTVISDPNAVTGGPANQTAYVVRDITDHKSGKFSFDKKLEYTEPGIYTYNVYEVENTEDLVTTYDKSIYTVTIKVEDASRDAKAPEYGVLKCTATYTVDSTPKGAISFTNESYDSNKYIPVASKSFVTKTGEHAVAIPDREFEFSIFDGTTTKTKKADSNGNVTFDEYTYTADDLGTHEYIIKEVPGNKANVEYSTNEFKAVVVVSENATTHKLEVADTYYKKDATVEGGWKAIGGKSDVKFTNYYKAEGDVSFEAYKVIKDSTGAESAKILPLDGEFTFDLYEGTEKIDSVDIVDGKATFGIHYTENDLTGSKTTDGKKFVKYYTIKENKDNPKTGFTYSDQEYAVVVTLEDKGNGTIETKCNIIDKNKAPEEKSKLVEWFKELFNIGVTEAIFENTYEAEGSVAFTAHKTYTGGMALDDNMFSFTISENGEEKETVKNTGENVTFSPISYKSKDIGTHTYVIRETKGSISGVTYSEVVYTATVVVADVVRDGKLEVNTSITDGTNTTTFSSKVESAETGACVAGPVEFVNNYIPTPTTISVGGTKAISGLKDGVTIEHYDGQFEFVMTNDTEKGNAKTFESKKNNANGSFLFDEISFSQEDLKVTGADGSISYLGSKEFDYVITETTGDVEGIDYDKSVKSVKIILVDNKDGTLSAYVDGHRDDPEAAVAFNNTYVSEDKLIVSVSKTTPGATKTDKAFSFTMTGPNGYVSKKSITAGQSATFAEVTYDLAKVKAAPGQKIVEQYIVSEDQENKHSGYEYSDKQYVIDVEVTYDSVAKKLVIDRMVNDEDWDGALTFAFENPYSAEGDTTIKGKKVVKNAPSLVTDGAFSFELRNEAGDVINTVPNDANGEFSFVIAGPDKDTKFTASDDGKTYRFFVRELTPKKDGITGIENVVYTDKEYPIIVTVDDLGDGHLDVKATPNSCDEIVFTNEFESNVKKSFTAYKSVEGRAVENIFQFKLEDISENKKFTTPETVTNSGETVNFLTEVTFDQNDIDKEFLYEISEIEGKYKDPYTYSDKKFYSKITVAVEGTELVATQKYYADKECTTEIEPSAVEFKNIYESKDEVKLSGNKFLEGQSDGSFSFVLFDTDKNEEVETVTVTGQKPYEFKPLEYNQNDLRVGDNYVTSKKHHYTVKEVNGGDTIKKLTYDNVVYTIEVEVSYDATTKKIKATPKITSTKASSVNSDQLNFTNVYKAEGSAPIIGTKAVTGKNLESGYKFALMIDSVEVAEASNTGSTFVFKAGEKTVGEKTYKFLKYDQNDVDKEFVYTVVEKDTTDGTKKDETVYTVADKITKNSETGAIEINRTVKKPDGTIVGDINDSGILFTNTYEAKGELVLDGVKTMKNRNLNKEVFSFVIKDENGDVLTYENEDGETKEYRVTNTVDIEKDAKTNNAVFNFSFPAIKYTQEDLKNGSDYVASKTIYYTVEEEGSQEGVVKSTAVYTVEVTLSDSGKKDENGDNLLDVDTKITSNVNKPEDTSKGLLAVLKARFGKADDDASIEFVNEYKASGVWDPEGTKLLTGREFGNNEFQFAISELDAPKGEVINDRTATVPNQGTKVKFDHNNVSWLNYSEEDIGKHYYKVRELDPGVKDDLKAGAIDNGWADKYDKSVFEYTIDVQDDGQGHLTPNVELVSIYDGDGKLLGTHTGGMFKFNFTNEYEAKGSVDLHATKNVTGRDLGDDQYDFTIQEVKAGNVVNTAVVQNNGNAIDFLSEKISFLNYTRDDLGNHEYVIRENDLDAKYADLEKDSSVYRVTVNVADKMVDGKPLYDGNLDIKVVKVEKQLSATEGTWVKVGSTPQLDSLFSFENTYKANAEINFIGTKHLRRAELATEDVKSAAELAGRYEFAVYQYTNKERTGDRVEVNKASCDGDGNYILRGPSFTEATLKEANGYAASKEFYYQVVEVKPTVGTWDNGKFTSNRGVTYDNTVYNVDVTVKPAPKGSNDLVIEVKDADKGTIINAVPNTDNLYTIGGAGYFDFVNYKPETTEIRGTKTWQGQSDVSKRPDVTIELRSSQDDFKSVIDTYVIHPTDSFQGYEFKNLPATDKFGKAIEYRTTEVDLPGYVSEKVGNDFINTKGNIVIRKINAVTGATVEGAVLAILSGGTEVERWTTTSSAHVVEATLERGATYTLREISAPDGYVVAADQTFTVPSDGSDIVVTMEDAPVTGAVRLRKLDAETREALSGAEFALYAEDGTRVYAIGTPGAYRYSTTASNGRFAVNSAGELEITALPYGTYYFTEIAAPSGYRLSTDRVSFTILRDAETVEVTFLNTKESGSVRLRKANADGSRALAGAVFELYAKTPSTITSAIASTIYRDAYYRVGSYTTDAAGMIYVGDLPWDDYYFVEVSAPTGYTLNRDTNGDVLVYAFTVGEGSRDLTYDLGTITNSTTPTTPPTPPVTPRRGGAVRGIRQPKDDGRLAGGVLSGVLGVRAAPKSGVLGERLGPVTGDAGNILLWLLLLLASIGSVVWVLIANKRRKQAK